MATRRRDRHEVAPHEWLDLGPRFCVFYHLRRPQFWTPCALRLSLPRKFAVPEIRRPLVGLGRSHCTVSGELLNEPLEPFDTITVCLKHAFHDR